MGRFNRFLPLVIAGAVGMAAHAVGAQQHGPGVGYLYPAGGQQGEVVRVIVGGQQLRSPEEVLISGRGVRASVVEYTGTFGFLQRPQQKLLLEKLWQAHEVQIKKAVPNTRDALDILEELRGRKPWTLLDREVDTDAYRIPRHPLLIDVEKRSLPELAHIQSQFFFPRAKLQDNRQLAEHVLLEIKIAPNAPPGTREFRLRTAHGISNPVRFQVGSVREVQENEPNDRVDITPGGHNEQLAELYKTKPLALPVLINGQVMPGDIDQFRFRARRDQELEIRVAARELIPYLADAVPGWFQAVLSLADESGHELAFADDTQFKPDPVLRYRVPKDGVYVLTIRDSIYRGRQDFVYRLSLGARTRDRAMPDAGAAPADLLATERKSLRKPDEREPNDSRAKAESVLLPRTVRGRIARPGDVDHFAFNGRAGQEIAVEVYARRLGSPLDSLVRLIDSSGEVLAWNDDHVLKEKYLHIDHVGLVTHHADSFLMATLPKRGRYTVQLSDAQRHGGPDYGYQLRMGPPEPDFALRVTPSSLMALPGTHVPVTIYALRQDGFDGEIRLSLGKVPDGMELTGGVIPAGANHVRATVRAPSKSPDEPLSLDVRGTARIDKKQVSHAAVPAENQMQAFLWRHLVPADELVMAVRKQRWAMPTVERVRDDRVRLVPGKEETVGMRSNRRGKDDVLFLRLDNPPPGIRLVDERVKVRNGKFELGLTADSDGEPKPYTGNLIVEMSREHTPKGKDGKAGKPRRQPVGYLPAIPVEVSLQRGGS